MKLTRQVPVRHEPGTSLQRRSHARAVVRQPAIAVTTLVVVFLLVSERRMALCTDTPVEVALMTTKKYAFDAFPQWSAQHADRLCPGGIEELNWWMNTTDGKDPWGTPYEMVCGGPRFGHAPFILVRSAGHDRTFGTTDDISSE